jgi:hypothetical protein
MLTMQFPLLLALLATALMAVVIFAPSRIPAVVTASCAPPPAPPAMERWAPAPDIDLWAPLEPVPETTRAPAWPTAIDPRAAACDATARLGLVDALATVRTPWSDAILRSALDDEPDSAVRAAVVAALAGEPSGHETG